MKQSPTRTVLVILFVFLGCFGVAYAAAGMLTALPAPAIGGTCGPSTASETALEALAEPGSIGAGPQPPTSNVTAHHQWATFIQQCQSLADRRGLASLAIFLVSIVVAGAGLLWVLRRNREGDGDGGRPVDQTYDQSSFNQLGLHDPTALVGAGVGGGAPVATWPPAPQPGYGPPPGYPSQPVPPPYPGAYPEATYPQPGWSGHAAPPPHPAYPPPTQQPAYPPAPGYQPPQPPLEPPPPSTGAPRHSVDPPPPVTDGGGQAPDHPTD